LAQDTRYHTYQRLFQDECPSVLLFLELFRVVLLAVSFLLLFIFGQGLIHANRKGADNGRRATVTWTIGLAAFWLLAVILLFVVRHPCGIECLAAGDDLSRYLLAIPASILAAFAMIRQRETYMAKGMPNCARDITNRKKSEDAGQGGAGNCGHAR